jgi:outer membrane protein
MKFKILGFLFSVFALPSFAQDYWDLEKCVTYALENNLTIKQTELSTKIAEQNLTQSKGANLPNLNGFASNTYNFGQTIDPFTNQFATQRVRSNSLGLAANMNLFSGFGNYNTIKQREYELNASRYDLDQSRNDISLAIASAYLTILFNEEQVEQARSQAAVTAKQVERTQKLVKAGTLPQGSLYEVEAQLASEELALTQALNNVDLAYLSLKQLLQVESDQNFRIVKPNLEIAENQKVESTPGQVYDKALNTLPTPDAKPPPPTGINK